MNRHLGNPGFTASVGAAFALCWGLAICSGPVWAQGGGRIPSVPGVVSPDSSGAAAVDTALAVLGFPTEAPIPLAIHTVQDTVLFGDVFYLVLDFPGTETQGFSNELTAGQEWLVPETVRDPGFWGRLFGRDGGPRPDLSDLPVAEGRRVSLAFRVYRTQPFQVQAGPFISGVIQVQGRIAGTGETAAIRAPRPVGWSPAVIALLILALVVILWLARLLWDLGHRGEELENRIIPAPAWLAAGIELRDLYRKGSLDRGDSRLFLDGLAGISRKFVAGRYRIAAQEMTGREIVKACTRLGHTRSNPGSFASLIDGLDHNRYNPESSVPAWCREQASQFFQLMGQVRVLPRYTDVPADLLLEGEKAWAELRRELAEATGRGSDRDPVTNERGA